MYQPELYKKSNIMQRKGSKEIVDQYFDYIQLRPDGRDSFLDIGCGPGDVLMDFVYPILPNTCSKIVGIDISPSMVQYSKKIYSQYENVDFKVLDIETPSLPIEYCEQFDHVISFYCLNWIRNQKQAFKNVHSMLTKNGDCLLSFVCSSPLYEPYKMMSMNPKWMEYMKDVDRFIPPLQYNPNPQLVYTKIFNELGFSDIKIEIQEGVHYNEGNKNFGDILISVNPFVERVPCHKREDFNSDLLECWANMGLCEEMPETNDLKYIVPYKRVIACGRK